MKIVAFGHRKNVGKSTATRFLIQELRLQRPGCSVVVAGFADKVKDIAFQLYSWTGLKNKHYYDQESNYHEKDKILTSVELTPRQIWIHVGNSIRTEGYDWTWAEYLFRLPKVDYLFIDDMRFPVEAGYVLDREGLVIRIDRPDQPKVTDGADEPLESFDKWSEVLTNDKGIKEFYATVIMLLPKILE